jgi:hypothetical protein
MRSRRKESGMLRVLIVASLIVVSLTTLPARQQATVEPNFPQMAGSANAHVRLFAAVLKESLWLQADRIIYVCWENLTPAPGSDADRVRQAVAGTWQQSSALTFAGWQPCAPRSVGIRIRVEDAGPHTKGLGRNLNGKPAGMVLNFAFNNWSPDCRGQRDYCIKTIAVHEFGHAIGLAHEQNRADAPGECRQLAQGSPGDLLLTPYDKDSVMNYCNPKYNNDGDLSPLDVAAVKELYGAPRR